MQNKIVIAAALIGLANPCFAYNDYGYSYGIATPYSGGFDSSMHVREIQNDAARQFELNASSSAALHNSLNNSYQNTQTQIQSPSTYTPSKGYVIDKPLDVFGGY